MTSGSVVNMTRRQEILGELAEFLEATGCCDDFCPQCEVRAEDPAGLLECAQEMYEQYPERAAALTSILHDMLKSDERARVISVFTDTEVFRPNMLWGAVEEPGASQLVVLLRYKGRVRAWLWHD